MRLATLSLDGSTTAAARLDGERAAVVELDGRRFEDVGELLRAGEPALAAAAAADPAAGTPFEPAQLRRPVLRPGVVVCVGLNYREHIEEMGRDLPENPTLFSKPARALTDPFATLDVPAAAAETLDYEGELAVVIGRGGRDIPAERAWEHVAGLTVLNDVTVRAHQRRTVQWFAGKSWQALTPVGPAVVTMDELPDLDEREMSVRVNGEERQRARLGNLVFGVEDLIADASQIMELEPGDLIATGTPGGVGAAMDPPGFLADGDEVEVTIDGIGTIASRVRVRR
jgi:acylpyruvate hydrolase